MLKSPGKVALSLWGKIQAQLSSHCARKWVGVLLHTRLQSRLPGKPLPSPLPYTTGHGGQRGVEWNWGQRGVEWNWVAFEGSTMGFAHGRRERREVKESCFWLSRIPVLLLLHAYTVTTSNVQIYGLPDFIILYANWTFSCLIFHLKIPSVFAFFSTESILQLFSFVSLCLS